MATSRTQSQNSAFWQNHVERWKASGLSQAAYCREHQLNEVSLSYHKRKTENTMMPVKASGFASVQLAQTVPPAEPLTLHFANGAHLSGITANNLVVVTQLARALA